MGIDGRQKIDYMDVHAFCLHFPENEKEKAWKCAEQALVSYWPESGFLGRKFETRWLDFRYGQHELIEPSASSPAEVLRLRKLFQRMGKPLTEEEYGELVIEGAIGSGHAYPTFRVTSF